MHISHLRTSAFNHPLGLDKTPLFSWRVEDATPEMLIPSANIQVLDASGAEVWDSGVVATPTVLEVLYAGPALAPRTPYQWRVRVRDQHGNDSEWSEPAEFETGLLGGDLGHAAWIRVDEQPRVGETAPVQYLRNEFMLVASVRRARAYSTALGWYRLSLNGADVLGPGFYPGFTAFEGRVEYQVRDITSLLRVGTNVIGIKLADGRFRGRIGAMGTPAMYGNRTAAIARLEIELKNGETVTVVTDSSWEGGHGRILSSDPRAGEIVDARISDSWNSVGGTIPDRVRVLAVEEDRTLVGVTAPALVELKPIAAISTTTSRSGAVIVDFGQNLHGLVCITARGPAGAKITVNHSEVLKPDGEVDLGYLTGGTPHNTYIGPNTFLLSGGTDHFQPEFCTQGFRYAAIIADKGVELLAFAAVPVQADLEYHGSFECSESLVKRFHDNVVWSMRGNFLDVPTDCPTRERSGWTGDVQVFASTALLLADAGAYLTNWLADARLQQHSDGTITDVVPLDSPNWREGGPTIDIFPGSKMPPSGSAGWGDAIVLTPWAIYEATGSLAALRENYDAMTRWVERYARMARQGSELYLVETGFHWGEWLEPPGEGDGTANISELFSDLYAQPRSWVATAYFEHSSRVLAEIAELLGHANDARRFRAYADGALGAWRKVFMTDPETLVPDAQATYVRALEFGLVPDERRAATAARLVERIRARGNHLGTGFLSTKFLLKQLSENGYGDVALDVLLQHTPPSWIGQVKRGATTTWETWIGYDDSGRALMSHNHYSLGAAARWLYEHLAGIRPASPGWRHITVDPLLNDRIGRVAASTCTPFGKVAIAWELDGDDVTLLLTVPVGTTADVRLDGATIDSTLLDGVLLTKSGRTIEASAHGIGLQIGSGEWTFGWRRRPRRQASERLSSTAPSSRLQSFR